uniref:Putative regulatory protein FmdB zinc ribbon domain-containing protein n=1 Tax=viral metagenome TaxID=1070528 RepID=A0A6H1ZTV3_9ZZZZ
MPIYEFHCRSCRKSFEEWHKVTRIPKSARCSCGMLAKRKPFAGNAVLTDGGVIWMDSAKQNLPDDARHVETRGEWKAYCRKKGLECVG